MLRPPRRPSVPVLGLLLFGLAACDGGDGPPLEERPDHSRTLIAHQRQGHSFGSFGAPVTVHALLNFADTASRTFAEEVFPGLRQTFIVPGDVRYIVFGVPIPPADRAAELAHLAARCASIHGPFWTYQDKLFQHQARWLDQEDPTEEFLKYGVQVGIYRDTFRTCLAGDSAARAVSANQELARRLGVEQTPALFVNGRRVEATSEDLTSAVRAFLPDSTDAKGGG